MIFLSLAYSQTNMSYLHPQGSFESTCIYGEGKTITEVADVVTLWKDLRADIQVNVDPIYKRTRLEVTGCGRSLVNHKEYFCLFTIKSTRQGYHHLVKTNYKLNSSGELQLYNSHIYNVATYTYTNQKLDIYIESYNDMQGLIRGCITLEPQTRPSYYL